jgi:hypothetical protein
MMPIEEEVTADRDGIIQFLFILYLFSWGSFYQ